MRTGINAAGEAARDYQAPIIQVPCQLLRHLIPVGGWTTRSYDRNHMAVKKLNVSKNIQDGWWVINFAQALRVFRPVPSEQADSSTMRLSQCLRRGAWVWGLWIACATAAVRRWDSSSVSEALKIASGLPIARSSFPAMRAPRPGVKASASHPRYWSEAIEVAASVRG